MVGYTPQEAEAKPDEYEIVVKDPTLNPVPEVETYIDGIAKLNAIKVKGYGKNIYRLEEAVRIDETVGKYTVLVLSEFKEDGRSYPIQVVTFIDEATGLPLCNMLNEDIKRINNQLRSKGIAAYQQKRGLELKAARSTKLRVQFTPEDDDGEKKFMELKRRLGVE